jgi:hypothetical protein
MVRWRSVLGAVYGCQRLPVKSCTRSPDRSPQTVEGCARRHVRAWRAHLGSDHASTSPAGRIVVAHVWSTPLNVES